MKAVDIKIAIPLNRNNRRLEQTHQRRVINVENFNKQSNYSITITLYFHQLIEFHS